MNDTLHSEMGLEQEANSATTVGAFLRASRVRRGEELVEVAAQLRIRNVYVEAIEEGRFDKSLVPVHNLDGSLALGQEEFPRPGTTAESLAKLPPSFPAVADYRHEDGPTFRELVNQKFPDLDLIHVHHAGNSSGVVDGAAAILFASEQYAKDHGLKVRAALFSFAETAEEAWQIITTWYEEHGPPVTNPITR